MIVRRHYFFDMDGTLSESRSQATPEMILALRQLAEKHSVIIISGADYEQMKKQLPRLPNRRMYFLAQSGTDASWGGRQLWKKKLNSVHKAIISEHIRLVKSIVPYDITDPNDLVHDRGGQISYSLIGHNEDPDKKKAFDPDGSIRTKLLKEYPFETEVCMVRIGGTTCLDYTAKNWGKSGNISQLIGIRDWKYEDCVYIGDQLYEGGNDYDMKDMFGAEGTISVKNPQETLDFIKRINEQV